MNVLLRHSITAPGIHVRTPGRVSGEMCECAECDRDQPHRQNRNGATPPTLFTLAGKKRKKQQEQSIKPQEKVIWLRDSLDDGRIRSSGRPKWTKVQRACGDRQDN